MSKKNVLIFILIPVLVLAVAISSILFYLSKEKKEEATAAVVVHSSEITGDVLTETNDTTPPTNNAGDETQVTYEDQMVLFYNPDEETAKELYDNEILLASIDSYMYRGGSLGVAEWICIHTIDMNDFIDSCLLWPEEAVYPAGRDKSSRLYISQLIGSMDGSTETPPTNFYPDITIPEQQDAVKYSISNQSQFPLDGNFKYCTDTLSGYMEAGHPEFTKIHAMVLSIDDPKVFDEIKSNLQAKIETDFGEYFVYLVYEENEFLGPGFKILDMVKLA